MAEGLLQQTINLFASAATICAEKLAAVLIHTKPIYTRERTRHQVTFKRMEFNLFHIESQIWIKIGETVTISE